MLNTVTYAPWGMLGGWLGGLAYFAGVILTGLGGAPLPALLHSPRLVEASAAADPVAQTR